MRTLVVILVVFTLVSAIVGLHIAPVKGAERRTRASWQFTYNGGALLQNVKVYNIYWTSTVSNQAEIDTFVSRVVSGSYLSWLSEYNAGGYTIGTGSLLGSVVLSNTGSTVSNTQVINRLISLINTNTVPTPTADTLYQFYFPSGFTITNGAGSNQQQSCVDFCGYHSSFNVSGPNQEIFYSVIADCGADVCYGTTSFESVTRTASHEIVEAITDPGSWLYGWYDNVNNEEVADVCNYLAYWTHTSSGTQYAVNPVWSINLQGCTIDGTSVAQPSSASSLSSSWLNSLYSYLL